jgi:hypothetical protein
MANAEGHGHVVFSDPIELADGTAWTHYAVGRALLPLPMEMSHVGIQILHHVYDGALYKALARFNLQL